MKWYEIIANTTSEGSDLIADAFFSIGCTGGVKIMDKNDVLDIINNGSLWDYIDDELLQKDNTARVSGFFSKEEAEEKLKEFVTLCKERNLPLGEINITEVDDSDWYDNWKKYYSPIDAEKYIIIPKWQHPDVPAGKIPVLIDPGMAFGTGAHESTKMCLIMMSKLDFADKNVIDVGTGSGILGTAALLSGAKHCYMCDIDSVAVKAAKENAQLNGVSDKAQIENADLLSKSEIIGDIVLANLTADILIRLSAALPDHIKKDGKLICSGIIHSRLDDVKKAFITAGMRLDSHLVMGEWDALTFIKN